MLAQERRSEREDLLEARRRALEAQVELPREELLRALPDPDFAGQIKPLLSENCFACHGFDEGARQAGVRLDVEDEATRPNRTGQAPIVPGDLSASRVAWRLFHPDASVRMPPPDSGKELGKADRLLLARWILDGAEYAQHWSYRPIQQRDSRGSSNPVDALIQAKLEAMGLSPSPEAVPEVLARRLALDLVGLPPTAAAIAPFALRYLSDPSEQGYLRYVDDLLASPHFGERMAVHWLDLVRYADTNGYHSDEPRSVSPYRDWVIRAFNRNMPFDRFTTEQLAGDLLENPTRDQRIASTFNRLNQLTAEGGAQEMEYRAKYDADRVRAVSTIWMGATLGCAECHDHKFDPYRQRDFYAMAAFFGDIEEHDVYTTGESWDPVMRMPSQRELEEERSLARAIFQIETRIAASDQALASARAEWERAVQEELERGASGWHPVTPLAWQAEGSELVAQDDWSLLATGPKPPGRYLHRRVPNRGSGRGDRRSARSARSPESRWWFVTRGPSHSRARGVRARAPGAGRGVAGGENLARRGRS